MHQPLDGSGRLPTPPALCVAVVAGPPNHRSASAFARVGVDHYWHLDSRSGVVEVSVRVDEEYRRAESVTISGEGEWIDFGVGVVKLTLPASLVPGS